MTTRTAIEYQDTKQFYKGNQHFVMRAVPDLLCARAPLARGSHLPVKKLYSSFEFVADAVYMSDLI